MERRWKAAGKLDEAWFPEENFPNFKKAIVTEIMSSENETFDTDRRSCFKVKHLSFHIQKYNKLMALPDKTYMNTCSKQSKEQFKVRLQGTTSKQLLISITKT